MHRRLAAALLERTARRQTRRRPERGSPGERGVASSGSARGASAGEAITEHTGICVCTSAQQVWPAGQGAVGHLTPVPPLLEPLPLELPEVLPLPELLPLKLFGLPLDLVCSRRGSSARDAPAP